MATYKSLEAILFIERAFETLEKLRFNKGNEELNDLWNDLLDICS